MHRIYLRSTFTREIILKAFSSSMKYTPKTQVKYIAYVHFIPISLQYIGIPMR